jgi:hypothetical protein
MLVFTAQHSTAQHSTAAGRGGVSLCLVGARDEVEAAGLLACVPDLGDSAKLRGQVARWLHDLYPTSLVEGREWIGALRPDPVAEQLVVDELAGRPGLVAGLFTGLGGQWAARALTILARAVLTLCRPEIGFWHVSCVFLDVRRLARIR